MFPMYIPERQKHCLSEAEAELVYNRIERDVCVHPILDFSGVSKVFMHDIDDVDSNVMAHEVTEDAVDQVQYGNAALPRFDGLVDASPTDHLVNMLYEVRGESHSEKMTNECRHARFSASYSSPS